MDVFKYTYQNRDFKTEPKFLFWLFLAQITGNMKICYVIGYKV